MSTIAATVIPGEYRGRDPLVDEAVAVVQMGFLGAFRHGEDLTFMADLLLMGGHMHLAEYVV